MLNSDAESGTLLGTKPILELGTGSGAESATGRGWQKEGCIAPRRGRARGGGGCRSGGGV